MGFKKSALAWGRERRVGCSVGVLLCVLFVVPAVIFCCVGVGWWGPRRDLDVRVVSKHVDVSNGGKSSHYMVITDGGCFEVDNGLLLWVWNADELYGRFVPGGRYRVRVAGNQFVNFLCQYYPYVVSVEPID